jgi:hypothetical protein
MRLKEICSEIWASMLRSLLRDLALALVFLAIVFVAATLLSWIPLASTQWFFHRVQTAAATVMCLTVLGTPLVRLIETRSILVSVIREAWNTPTDESQSGKAGGN